MLCYRLEWSDMNWHVGKFAEQVEPVEAWNENSLRDVRHHGEITRLQLLFQGHWTLLTHELHLAEDRNHANTDLLICAAGSRRFVLILVGSARSNSMSSSSEAFARTPSSISSS